ncbi:MAG: cell division protein FtsX [Bacteroidetes bacterium HGW-Bacteroidetes-6]|jgi:cell division transport system permease protein|nr:MAG: cell division protein FtsX [Bacteroidetes bacterium HGW-Bacteroidetes-6]
MGKKNKSAIRLGGSYITMIISISLVLLILGLSGLILLQSKGVVKIAKENILITVMFKDSLPEADMLALQKKMQMNEKVKTCDMVSSEEAAKRMVDETGEDFVTDLGFIPIPPSLDITVESEYGDSANIEALVADVMKEPIVGNVYYDKDQVQDINANTQSIMLYLLGFAVIVFIISYSLISNTIRLAIYSKRFIIRSMLLVGATRGFIRRPFLLQSLWMGAVSSLIALILLEGVMTLLYNQIPDLRAIQDDTQMYFLFGGIVLSGMLISWLSSWSALNRYIKMKTDFLYI